MFTIGNISPALNPSSGFFAKLILFHPYASDKSDLFLAYIYAIIETL